MFQRFSLAVAAVFVSLSLVACGPPPLEEIVSNLDNPTAELNGSLIALGFKSYDRGASAINMPTMGKHGKMVSFLKVGKERKTSVVPMKDYLIQSGVPSQIADRILPYLPVNDDMSVRKKILDQGEYGTLQQPLPLGDCLDGSANLLNGSFSMVVDLSCLKQGSGSIKIVATAETELLSKKKASFRMDIHFNNACDEKGHCIDGSMLYKVGAIAAFGLSGAELKLLLSMSLRVTASGETVNVKQGIRVSYATDTKTNKVEIVTYIKDEEGRERTLVIEVSASDERGSFSVRGAGGQRYSCRTSDHGLTGHCSLEGRNGSSFYKW